MLKDLDNPQFSDEQYRYARSAVEHIYGYMVRNGKRVGILTTVKGWSFMWRENGGELHMTRLFGDFHPSPPVSEDRIERWGASGTPSKGALAEGYSHTTGFSIMKALYYISYLAHKTDDFPETPTNGCPGEMFLPISIQIMRVMKPASPLQNAPSVAQVWNEHCMNSKFMHEAVSRPPLEIDFAAKFPRPPHRITGPDGTPAAKRRAYQVVGGYDEDTDCFQFQTEIDCRSLQFEPWKKENSLGWKTWKAIATASGTQVVLKMWDDWLRYGEDLENTGKELRDDEVAIYLHLQPIWGKYVPSLLASSPVDFFHALVVEYIPDVYISFFCLD